MLQRIQTIFILVSLIGTIIFYTQSQDINTGFFDELIMIFCVILLFLGSLSIFSFKNRKRQVLLNFFGIAINVLLITLSVFWLQSLSGGMDFPEKGIEPMISFLSMVSLFLANRYIRKDERLVKSVDRLR